MADNSRKVYLVCPVCGSSQFLFPELDDIEMFPDAPSDTEMICSDCGTVTTKGQLLDANRENININMNEVAEEELAELKRKLKRRNIIK